MNVLFRVLLTSAAVLVVLVALAWLGLQVPAAAWPTAALPPAPATVSIPAGLPAPVERYARAVYGDELPVIDTAVVYGRARLAPTGMYLPSRFRFYYDRASASHYHHIEVLWYRLPLLRIHERNREGVGILDLGPLGRVEDAPNTNIAGQQGFWAEVLAWVPAMALNDSRITWEAVDDNTARAILPGLGERFAFTVRFDAETGLLTELEAARYQSEDGNTLTRWTNRTVAWADLNGVMVPVESETQWADDEPWAYWAIDQVVVNADVTARFEQFGGDLP